MLMTDLADITVGISKNRIDEGFNPRDKVLTFYGQSELEEDLWGVTLENSDRKQMKVAGDVPIVKAGDIIFSLVSGTTAMVSKDHDGYIWTQNFAKLTLKSEINPKYLIYLLNESKEIKRQFSMGLQGTAVIRYTAKLLRDLKLPKLPPKSQQEIMGNIYFKALHLKALKERMEANKLKRTLMILEGM